ncbi:MAG TPA: hypothetical protein PKM65_19625 [Spirochaetota bacterium]|nr:hypothetical protein [Spirochaetota bacterium]HNT12959.1 hypothetical protein [Spirochaetota bacterium]
MSVILKSHEEIRALAGGLIHHRDRIRDILEVSNAYRRVKNGVGSCIEEDGGSLEEVFICWLMFRMWVANKVAFSIQYGIEVNLPEVLTEVTPWNADLQGLAADLRNLNYNIFTNGGQCWMDHEWHSLFCEITDRITADAELRVSGGVL